MIIEILGTRTSDQRVAIAEAYKGSYGEVCPNSNAWKLKLKQTDQGSWYNFFISRFFFIFVRIWEINCVENSVVILVIWWIWCSSPFPNWKHKSATMPSKELALMKWLLLMLFAPLQIQKLNNLKGITPKVGWLFNVPGTLINQTGSNVFNFTLVCQQHGKTGEFNNVMVN